MKLSNNVVNNILSEVFRYDNVVDGEKESRLRQYLKNLELFFDTSQSFLSDLNDNSDSERQKPGWGED